MLAWKVVLTELMNCCSGRPASPKGKSAKSPGAPGTSNGAAALGPRVGPEGQQNDRDSQPAGQSTDVLLAEHRASGLHKRGTRFSSETGADVCSRPSLLSDISLYSESLFKHVPVTVTNENQFDSSDDVDTSHVHHHVHHYLHHSSAEASTSINFKDDDFLPWAEEYPVLTPDFYDEYGRVTHSQTKQRQRLQSLEEKLDIQAKQFFHIDRVIWRGYYSIVLAGIFRASGQMVAIKIVKKNTDEEQLSHILTEHKVLANHSRSCPFIVRLHSAFQTKLHCYLIMEFVEGGSLDERLSVVGVYPERVAVFYLAEISLAMFFLHKRGVLHRDLRLKNVMLKSDGHVRIIDFGLSKMNWKDSNKFEMVGTLKEMAPEMHQNTPYNKAVDYWSVGLILYALVHGELPFKGKTRVDIFKAVTIEKEKYNNNLNANTTVALCKELLRKNQKRRLGYEDDSETVMKSHPFFADVNWVRMERRLYTPPYMPITDMDDESGVTESTWPDLSEQNAVFDGKEVPRRLSLALGDASLNHQVPKIVVKPIKNGTFDPSDIVPVKKLSGGVLVQPHRGSHSVDGKKVSLNTSPRDQEPTEQSQMKVDSAVNLQKNVEFKPVAQNDLLLLSPVDNWEITSVGKDFTVFTLNKPPTPEKQSCLRGCWAECSYKCHVEAATCRALCCGLENVKPPHKLQRERAPRPSIILTQPTSATEDSRGPDKENDRQIKIYTNFDVSNTFSTDAGH